MVEEAFAHGLEASLLLGSDFLGCFLLFDWLIRLVRLARGRLLFALATDYVQYGDDNGAAPGLLKQIVRNVVLQLGLKPVYIYALVTLLHSPAHLGAQAIHHFFLLAHVYKAAAYNIWAAEQVATSFIDSQHNRHKTFFGQ